MGDGHSDRSEVTVTVVLGCISVMTVMTSILPELVGPLDVFFGKMSVRVPAHFYNELLLFWYCVVGVSSIFWVPPPSQTHGPQASAPAHAATLACGEGPWMCKL